MKKHTFFFAIVLLSSACAISSTVAPSDAQMKEIGKRIWNNECGGTISGLTSWNQGEGFPSLGIAHCIWYPAGKRDRFEESWPSLARYLKNHGTPIGPWMLGTCPWRTRQAFMSDFKGPRLTALRKILAQTFVLQTRYTVLRLERALPIMFRGLSPEEALRVKTNFERIAKEPLGFYALIDYVNFKGEGVNPSERYQGQGWGLLQILEMMPTTGPALPAFVKTAEMALQRRVDNAPAMHHEAQWLPGWNNRLQTYLN